MQHRLAAWFDVFVDVQALFFGQRLPLPTRAVRLVLYRLRLWETLEQLAAGPAQISEAGPYHACAYAEAGIAERLSGGLS